MRAKMGGNCRMKQYSVGIDLGGTKIAAGVVDENNRIVGRAKRPTAPTREFERIADDMAAAARDAVTDAGLQWSDMVFFGVGTPGFVDARKGRVAYASNLNWHQVELGQAMQKRLGAPVAVSNDANCAALGEVLAGAAKDRSSALLLTLGTGVGGGIILGRRIFSGSDGMGSELGHVRLIHGGERCSCGQSGCIEAYCSATALIRQTTRAMEKNPSSALTQVAEEMGKASARTAFIAARRGDEVAHQVVDTYIEYLAAALAGLICVFRPEIILLGGGISHEGEPLLEPLNRILPGFVTASDKIGCPPVRAAGLGNDAGIIGAANLGRDPLGCVFCG